MFTIAIFLAITLSRAVLAVRGQWPLVDPLSTDSDPAGHPNIASRLEITSSANTTLFCARDGDTSESGYVHFTNSLGIEDKHMFWCPCRLVAGDDGNGTAIPSNNSWMRDFNVLAIDHPVGVGYSYGEPVSLRNSSARAAWDVDDFLQAFWANYPELAKNKFVIQSASYGGTYIPHIVNTILERNHEAKSLSRSRSSRFLKMPDSAVMGNIWSDIATNFRWFVKSNCDDIGVFNASACTALVSSLPACLDAVELALEQPTLSNKRDVYVNCREMMEFKTKNAKNPYDVRYNCTRDDCFPQHEWMSRVGNSSEIRKATGVPDWVDYKYLAHDTIGALFDKNGDHMQQAYKLLAPAINAGMRLLVYNGNTDGVCAWRSNLAWMKLLKTRHQDAFREARAVIYPGVGWFQKVGAGGAGEYTFLSIKDAGHFVEWDQQAIFQEFLVKWVANEPFTTSGEVVDDI
ncbi:hypothetical protein EWM64_g4699 [Hericium alpestre]|uniref:Carboxypeptidase n=1 Tax=Hericium alpestre TaxID=135208 RepID=A0A4Y9ZWX9_9AGAM|nr:hypothetical protein EWM64_g4699 [Hericium alpestre]